MQPLSALQEPPGGENAPVSLERQVGVAFLQTTVAFAASLDKEKHGGKFWVCHCNREAPGGSAHSGVTLTQGDTAVCSAGAGQGSAELLQISPPAA